jgi:lon-related putative ATP-dependent protease
LVNELQFDKLRKRCDPVSLQCEATDEITPLEGIIGQERAVKALKFGLDIEQAGFNIYVAGYPGTGRTTAVKGLLEAVAKTKPAPSDWCYVNNFANPYEPKAIRLPAGQGKDFKNAVAQVIDEARRALPKAFESEEYSSKREATIKALEEERDALLADLNKRAQEQGFVIQISSIGIIVIPVVKGKPLSEREFMALSPQVRDEIQRRREQVNADLRDAMRQLRSLEGKVNEVIEKLNQDVALFAVGHLFDDLKERYKDYPEVVNYLDGVKGDIIENLDQFLKPEASAQEPPQQSPIPWLREPPLRKYEVNVIVDNSSLKGGPVVIEFNPTYQNLIGKIEKEAQFGVLSTDFTMIRGGSLHRANGGYLVLPIEETLRNTFSWEGLKSALRDKRIVIEEIGERLGAITTKGLRPEPIPLNVKVILMGEPLLHQLLYMYDKSFKELFKVKAEFDTTMDRTDDNVQKYTAFICTFCQKENLKHLDASAIAKIIEYGSRLAEDQEKMTTRFSDVADMIREASYYAGRDGSKYITGDHIEKAIEEKLYRSNTVQERIQEMIQRGVLLIDTEGQVAGQVNGLSVMSLGDFSFGTPSRVTASIGLGREGIIDIERRARMGGPIHTKGVLILSGYLAQKYARDKPLSLSARLVFEQSYGGVEGDSASSTELYALLSALSGLPIVQNLAVTGSVNQQGEVQAIGGVNEKIEGFFEVCKGRGLTGKQGVMIPESNVQNLMLKEEVLEAVKAGRFHVYAVKDIDQGIEVLTGVKAGARQPDGQFEEGTVNYRVDESLREMAKKFAEASRGSEGQ